MRYPALFAVIIAAHTLAAQQADRGREPDTRTAVQPAGAGTNTTAIRGLYVNRWAAQSKPKVRALIQFARETGVNALVFDLKDEFGLNYHPVDSIARRYAGTAGVIPDVRWLIDTMRANGLLPIARVVVFKDSVAARARPEWTILGPDGHPWHDKQGLTWVNPYHHDLWEYDLRVATELAHLGFAEIQFDYIRFPEPYPSLPKQTFPGANGASKPDVLAGFLKEARARLTPLGVRTTADVFGLVTTVHGALEVGQQWEALASAADVLLPMVYPSHYVHGSFGIALPNGAPYAVVKAAISRGVERNAALGLTGERIRPYLQAFTLGKPAYGGAELTAQINAAHDAGANGWILWNPGSRYDLFKEALKAASVAREVRH